MNKIAIVCLFCFGLIMTSTAWCGGGAHWGYSGKEGPEYWGALDSKYSLCSEGKNQSPINLTGMIEGELPPLAVNYKPGGHEVVNNGHAIQINYKSGSTITVSGHQFELKQFHFHSPSENTIEGKSYPLEAHFVHVDKMGNLAVISLMFESGQENGELEKAWKSIPEKAGKKVSLKEVIDANILLPKERDYYRFNGSLTTPPCSEGVWWLVMKNIPSVSKEQIDKFSKTMQHPNNRPVQSSNARLIVK